MVLPSMVEKDTKTTRNRKELDHCISMKVEKNT